MKQMISHFPAILAAHQAPAIITRRGFLVGAAGLASATALQPAWAQRQPDSIHDLTGVVRVNGERINSRGVIKAGDLVTTGSDGKVVFVVGGDAFFLRERSELQIDKSTLGDYVVSSLRMLTGAVGAVFGKRQGAQVSIATPTVTAGIRGTGCYMESRGEGTYFCTCYGAIELTGVKDSNHKELVAASRHNPRMVLNEPRDGKWIVEAPFETHTDGEMDMLEKCVGRRAPWVAR